MPTTATRRIAPSEGDDRRSRAADAARAWSRAKPVAQLDGRWRPAGASSPSTAVRRFAGPAADVVYVLCQPSGGGHGATRQAETVYEGLLDALAAHGIGPEAIVTETVFARGIREHFEAIRSARSRVLRNAGLLAGTSATTIIGQAPLDTDADLELMATAVRPRSALSWPAHDVTRTPGCLCGACLPGVRARVVRVGDQRHLYAGNVYGSGRTPFEEASSMFRLADDLLARAGMCFGDVLRTWIHVRDIERDYDALNKARREFFRDRGIGRRPASTGVQGMPFPDAHAFSLGLQAAASPHPLDVVTMSTPFLNEAWSYGSDFSRGLRIADANQVTLHVSGTASVDEAGRTAHVGDVAAQADRMLGNVASLLAGHGATFGDVVSAVAYLKDQGDAPLLRSVFRTRGFEGFPCAVVHAPLCRSALLCEVEAVAILPLPAPGA